MQLTADRPHSTSYFLANVVRPENPLINYCLVQDGFSVNQQIDTISNFLDYVQNSDWLTVWAGTNLTFQVLNEALSSR